MQPPDIPGNAKCKKIKVRIKLIKGRNINQITSLFLMTLTNTEFIHTE